MGERMMIGEHRLLSTLQRVEESAQVRAWEQSQAEPAGPVQKQARILMEAAADNPIAMTIFARRIIKGESYSQATAFVSRVTQIKISNGAARVLVHRMLHSISDA